jgi:hypothetical protein
MKNIFLLALLALASIASAEILVYEGFHPEDYGNVAADANTTASSHVLTGNHTKGVVTSKWDGMGGTQIKVFGENYGLQLSTHMEDAGFETVGGSIGLNPGSNSSEIRAMRHNLATDVLKLEDGDLYIRMLLKIDAKAAGKLVAKEALTNADGGYFGFGLCQSSGSDYNLLRTTASAFSFCIWKNTNSELCLSVSVTDANKVNTSYPIITGISLDTTYICYAKIQVGAGTDGKEIIQVGAADSQEYAGTKDFVQITDGSNSFETDFITSSSYPRVMAVSGPYGTNKGRFLADELLVATREDDLFILDGVYVVYADEEGTANSNSFSSQYKIVSDDGVMSNASIVYSTDETFSNAYTNSVGSSLVAGVYNFEILNLEPETTYFYKVIIDKGSEQAESEVMNFKTVGNPKLSVSEQVEGRKVTFTADLTEAALENGIATAVSVFYQEQGAEEWIELKLGEFDSPVQESVAVDGLTYGIEYNYYAKASVVLADGRELACVTPTYSFIPKTSGVFYVDAASENPVDPYSTRETAAATLDAALLAAGDDSTIYVAPGVYTTPRTKALNVNYGVRIIGEGEPSSVVVSNAVESGYYNQERRIFVINHPDALVANLTMTKGEGYNRDGGNFSIGENGGIVSNCLVLAGYCRDNGTAAGGALKAGKVTHTIFRGNRSDSGSREWFTWRSGVLLVQGSARVDNCLFEENNQNRAVVLIKMADSSVMRNCTIVNNSLSATNQYCSYWSALEISSNATIENVVVAGVTNTVDGGKVRPGGAVARFVNGAIDSSIEGTAFPENTIVGTAEDFFTDYAAGNYRPSTGGILIDKGVTYFGMPKVDLSGQQPRKIGSSVDIGCYEGFLGGTVIILR